MLKCVRRALLCIPLVAVLAVMAPAIARADDPPNMQDYYTYWQVATDPTPPDQSLDYNTYWLEVQAKQQNGQQ
jgi:hypothetical protein